MATSGDFDCDTAGNAYPPGNGNALVDFTLPSFPAKYTRGNSSDRISLPPGSPDRAPSEFNIVTINISGLRFQTFQETLERFPHTLLGDPVKRGEHFNPKLGEYFFDRHRGCFETILYYYQSMGKTLKRPPMVPLDVFVPELKYFEMGDDVIMKLWASEGYVQPKEVVLPKNHIQRRVWQWMEHPDSSMIARVLAFVSVFVIVISTASFCLETTELRGNRNPVIHSGNVSSTVESTVNEVEADHFENPFFIIEFTCMIWFTIEFVLRFASSPSKLEFCKSILNIIDFLAIVPFYINLAWYGAKGTSGTMPFAVLRIFRLVRVFRIFKLSRHSRGLQILGKTFKASVQELSLLVFFLFIGLVLFSSAIYIFESGREGTEFHSIPASFWYVIITMTTVGYGDMVPKTPLGKLVGGTCAIMGVLVLALPVPVIVANFKHYYKQERHLARMRALENDTADNEMCDDDSGSS